MPIDKVSYGVNFMTIRRQKNVPLMQNSLLKHDIYISADIWGHQRVDISLRHRNRWHSVYLWRGVSWCPYSCTWCDWWFLLWVRRWRFPVQSTEECVISKQRLVHHVEKWVYFIDSLFIHLFIYLLTFFNLFIMGDVVLLNWPKKDKTTMSFEDFMC